MNCPKCGTEIGSVGYCIRCGFSLKNKQSTIKDENRKKFLSIFIGKNEDEFRKETFSVATFLLSIWYLLYRKMYKPAYTMAFLFFVLFVIASGYIDYNLKGISILYLIYFLINFLLARKTKSLYMRYAKRETKQIEKENRDSSVNIIADICKKRGGTSLIPPILFSLIYPLILGAIALLFYFL